MRSELKKLYYLTSRNIKLYFKDKMTFFVSLITPLILLILFITFLNSTYQSTILEIIGDFSIDDRLIDGFTGGWLFSSVLSVSCITVAFCSGIMIIDKINKANVDFVVTPIKKSTLQFSYVLSNLFSTMIVCFVLLIIGLIYLSFVGFYLSFVDILLILVNIFITSLFGTILANIIWSFTNSQGVMSGICTLVSALYGFICGAYMPINTMGSAMQAVTAFLPGTYSTILFRQGFLRGTLDEMSNTLPPEMIDGIATGFDYNFSFFGADVSTLTMFLVVLGATLILLGVLKLISNIRLKKKVTKVKTIQ